MTTLHQKTGNESVLKKFTFRIREMCRDDDLPRYAMTLTTTQDGSPAVHFVDRSFASHEAKAKKVGEGERRIREDGRAAWIDAGRDPRKFDGAWTAWREKGLLEKDFATVAADRRAVMPA